MNIQDNMSGAIVVGPNQLFCETEQINRSGWVSAHLSLAGVGGRARTIGTMGNNRHYVHFDFGLRQRCAASSRLCWYDVQPIFFARFLCFTVGGIAYNLLEVMVGGRLLCSNAGISARTPFQPLAIRNPV
ncbi:hypothetical protein G7K_4490-t1 [Saitoella complicata NRRL Y-17804]|uniref:Uncharacterized protein n=1 Tax=Saitoella complicata (strain BCRC 22490 / CBS 7301 / JCM 7358 / NBRC 10748 / NRRL Y-17804) TaxID=698492 RepID=A0A0E9NKN9_SAICN|nr:hypothetical protein G7K_4490-t1 [Saitoella complicata NRRL Y-17804]